MGRKLIVQSVSSAEFPEPAQTVLQPSPTLPLLSKLEREPLLVSAVFIYRVCVVGVPVTVRFPGCASLVGEMACCATFT